jgi:5-methylcytosine-specific restriction endonuclease McrA
MSILEMPPPSAGVDREDLSERPQAGIEDGKCERCGISTWRGAPLTTALHHINGDRYDNRIENLELLCPNCHSQTDTFGGRNGGRAIRPAT